MSQKWIEILIHVTPFLCCQVAEFWKSFFLSFWRILYWCAYYTTPFCDNRLKFIPKKLWHLCYNYAKHWTLLICYIFISSAINCITNMTLIRACKFVVMWHPVLYIVYFVVVIEPVDVQCYLLFLWFPHLNEFHNTHIYIYIYILILQNHTQAVPYTSFLREWDCI